MTPIRTSLVALAAVLATAGADAGTGDRDQIRTPLQDGSCLDPATGALLDDCACPLWQDSTCLPRADGSGPDRVGRAVRGTGPVAAATQAGSAADPLQVRARDRTRIRTSADTGAGKAIRARAEGNRRKK